MIKCVIFDLDDTLYPEIDYCQSGFRAISKLIGERAETSSEAVFDSIWSRFNSGDREKLFNKIFDEYSCEYCDADIRGLIKSYREHTPQISLPQESFDILEELKSKYSLALLSDGFMPAQQLKVDSLGIGHYFQSIVFSEQLGREFWKPSPVGFKKILAELKIFPEQAVYVGDNIKKDFIAPNELGMSSIQYLRKEKVHPDVDVAKIAEPDKVITSFYELAPLLRNL